MKSSNAAAATRRPPHGRWDYTAGHCTGCWIARLRDELWPELKNEARSIEARTERDDMCMRVLIVDFKELVRIVHGRFLKRLPYWCVTAAVATSTSPCAS